MRGSGVANRRRPWRGPWVPRVLLSLLGGIGTSVLLSWWVCMNGAAWCFHIPRAWQWPTLLGWHEETRGEVGVGMTVTEMPLASIASVRLRHGAPDIAGDREMQDQAAAGMGLAVARLDRIPGWAEARVSRAVRELAPEERALLTVQVVGWPVPCMRLWFIETAAGRTSTSTWGPALRVNPSGMLPVTPVPTRLAMCTLFWALPWMLGLTVPGVVRRWNRRRGGRCPECNYRLSGLAHGAVCPECGGAPCRPRSPERAQVIH